MSMLVTRDSHQPRRMAPLAQPANMATNEEVSWGCLLMCQAVLVEVVEYYWTYVT